MTSYIRAGRKGVPAGINLQHRSGVNTAEVPQVSGARGYYESKTWPHCKQCSLEATAFFHSSNFFA